MTTLTEKVIVVHPRFQACCRDAESGDEVIDPAAALSDVTVDIGPRSPECSD